MNKKLLTFLFLLLGIVLVSCSKKTGQTNSTTTSSTTTTVSSTSTGTTTASSSESEEDRWKKEPRYGTTIRYYISDGCTAGTVVADLKGFYQKEGLKVEGIKGKSDVEMLGLGNVDVVVGHISKQLVPATNGVDIVFVSGAHRLSGCKTLVVPADSPIQYIEDLKGKSIACPNGRGNSDYNITARLLDAYGIDPVHDINIKVVESSASVFAMQKGEVDAALLGEAFVYDMVNDGTLRKLHSRDGEDMNQICCGITMNKKFVEENPITAQKTARAVRAALRWMEEIQRRQPISY